MTTPNSRDLISGSIHRTEEKIKHGTLKLKRKKLKDEVLKDSRDQIPNYEREKSCKNARRTAHTGAANAQREVSNEVRKDLGL